MKGKEERGKEEKGRERKRKRTENQYLALGIQLIPVYRSEFEHHFVAEGL